MLLLLSLSWAPSFHQLGWGRMGECEDGRNEYILVVLRPGWLACVAGGRARACARSHGSNHVLLLQAAAVHWHLLGAAYSPAIDESIEVELVLDGLLQALHGQIRGNCACLPSFRLQGVVVWQSLSSAVRGRATDRR